ncbi:MAG: D-aminoacylase [Litorilinea sp.]
MYDLLIQNGTVVDGTGAPGFAADVAISGDRIVKVGNCAGEDAAHVIDAQGKIVAPGFVDVHNHSDAWLLKTPHLVSKTTQGFTAEVIMADGISYAPVSKGSIREWVTYLRGLNALRMEDYTGWESLADYMGELHGRNVQNSIPHVAYANVRALVCGFGRAKPDDTEMKAIQSEIAKGMDAGAVGLSTGLDYIVQCFASTDELVAACAPLAEVQGLYVTHMRYKHGTMAALREAVEIGKRAGIPVHISHLKGTSPAMIDEIMAYIDTVAVNEVDFSFDVYPYLPGSTMLNFYLPYAAWENGPLGVASAINRPEIMANFARALEHTELGATHLAWTALADNKQWQGRFVNEYVAARGVPAAEALADLLIEEQLATLMVVNQGDNDLVLPFLAHDKYMMGTDGIYQPDGVIHPRQYGSAPRLLGWAVREKQIFSLESAVRKLSGYPAQRFGLTRRGELHAGWFADVVVFDANTVADRATFTDPHQTSVGIEHVIVNGEAIIADSAPLTELDARRDAGNLPGRALAFHQER